MTGLDTNVVVRYIMQDDARQSPLATQLIESMSVETPGFITVVSVIELVWVFESVYQLNKHQVVQALEGVLSTKELVVERAEIVWKAVRLFQAGPADFADCLIERSAMAAGCVRTLTFDRGAVKGCGMVLVA
jgi:predicted nucleic-acid-binding protein